MQTLRTGGGGQQVAATATDVIARQVALYGEPLADRFARLLAAYGIPQSRLAATIGLSAPMLSQLSSGHRVKIGNPAVLARLLSLEELADSPAIRAGDPTRIAAALDEVAGSHPTLHTGAVADRGAVLAGLAATGTSTELATAAAAVTGSALGTLLQEAARERHAREREG